MSNRKSSALSVLRHGIAKKLGLLMDLKIARSLLGAVQRSGKPKRYEQMDLEGNWRKVRWFRGHTAFGPAFKNADEWAHGSRQVRRAALFNLNFIRASQQHPLETRRARRNIARSMAKQQYRFAMKELMANG